MIPEHALESLRKSLESADVGAAKLKEVTGLSGEKLESILLLFENRDMPQDVLLLALETALAAAKRTRRELEKVDLSWTGPVQFSVEGRSTVSVVEEMLKIAKKTITVVGYSVTKDARNIIDLLSAAMKNNVMVIIVIHHDESNDNIEVMKRLWTYEKKPSIYTRIPGKNDVYFKIHAKMIVVDSEDLLVTSANLTWHGMSNNLEVGLRVRGKTAEKAQGLVDDLIQRKYLKEVSW